MTRRTMTILTACGLLVFVGLVVPDVAALEYPIASAFLLASIRRVTPTPCRRLVGPRRTPGGAR